MTESNASSAPNPVHGFSASSAAVAALEQSLQASTLGSAQDGRCRPMGQPIPCRGEFDLEFPSDAVQLPASTVTKVASAAGRDTSNLIAVNHSFIAYGLQPGHIRIIERASGARTLLKGHSGVIHDIKFAAGQSNLLATAGPGGRLLVWELSMSPSGDIERATVFNHTLRAGAARTVLAWAHPDILCAATAMGPSGPCPGLLTAVAFAASGAGSAVEQEIATAPVATTSFAGSVVAALENGQVVAWDVACALGLPNRSAELSGTKTAGITLVMTSNDPDGQPSGVVMLHGAEPEDPPVLVLATKGNVELRTRLLPSVWNEQGAEESTGWQTLHLPREQAPYKLASATIRGCEVLVLAGTAGAVVLRASRTGVPTFLESAACFKLGAPVLGLDVLASAAGALELSVVQAAAVQQYTLEDADVALGVMDEHALQTEGLYEVDAAVVSKAAVEHSDMPTGTEAVDGTLPPPPLAGVLSAQASSGSTRLLSLREEVDHAEEGPLASRPAGAGPAGDDSSTPQSTSSSVAGGSGRAEQEECPSPPSSPVGGREVQVPVPVFLPSHGSLSATGATESQPGDAAATPQLLARRQLLRRNEALAAESADDAGVAATQAPGTVLRSSGSASSSVAQRPTPTASGAIVGGEDAVTGGASVHDDGEAGRVTPSASSVERPPGVVEPAGASESEGIQAVVAAALDGSHRKFVGHVTLMLRELVKSMRGEFASLATAQHASQQAALQLMLQEVRDMVAAERVAALEEERARTQAAVLAATQALADQLASRQERALREELDALQGQVASAVHAGITAAFAERQQQQLLSGVGSVGSAPSISADSLGPGIARAVSSALAPTLEQAFSTAFAHRLVPGFEAACGVMARQLGASLAAAAAEEKAEVSRALAPLQRATGRLEAALAAAEASGGSLLLGGAAGGLGLPTREPSGSFTAAAGGVMTPRSASRAAVRAMLETGRVEDAFRAVLAAGDVGVLTWLCGKPAASTALAAVPCPLSAPVLLSVMQQLATSLAAGPVASKAEWIGAAAAALDAADAVVAAHGSRVLRDVYAELKERQERAGSPADAAACRAAAFVVKAQLADLQAETAAGGAVA